ncbi:MAG: YfcC family protein [Paraclostridium sp.]
MSSNAMHSSKVAQKKKKGFTVPHTYAIIFGLIVVVAILTWFIPSGEFIREEINGRMTVIPGTYKTVESNPQGITDILKAPMNGFINAAEVVGFVLFVGGAFGIVNKTGAIENGICQVVNKLQGREMLIIPISMLLFGMGGSTFGLSEETLPFYMIFIPLMIKLGYDSLTAVATVFLGAGVGFAAGTTNPFSVGLGQALAQLTPGSGIGFRAIIFVIFMTIAISFVMMYAKKVKNNPEKSLVRDIDIKNKEKYKFDDASINKFSKKDILVLSIFIFGIIFMIYGILTQGWYIAEIVMVFTGIGLLSGLVGGLKQDEIATSFIAGAKDLASAAIAIALARGIVIIAQNGYIIDTILNESSEFLGQLPKAVFINLTFFLESALDVLIPSSSGLASLTVPVLAPLGDLLDVSGQSIITAFHLGSGLTNLITPTAGVLMGALSVAGIPWSRWIRFMAPFIAVMWIATMCLLTASLYIF